jgi:hypothetical protein
MTYPTCLVHIIVTAASPIDDAHSQIVQFCLRPTAKQTFPPPTPSQTTDPDVRLSDTPIIERSGPYDSCTTCLSKSWSRDDSLGIFNG